MVMHFAETVLEKFVFIQKFLKAPKQIGSVTPSSKYLAAKMIESVPWNRVSHLAELGAGTGAITKHIVSAKTESTKVLLFETDAHLRKQLHSKYPDCCCYPDALQLRSTIQCEGIEKLDCILSGLPFYNFHPSVRDELMEQIWGALKPGGLFIAFQYSLHMKERLRKQFGTVDIKFVPLNVPPAFVYVCRKGDEP